LVLTKKDIIKIGILSVLALLTFTYAYSTNPTTKNPAIMGHSAGELNIKIYVDYDSCYSVPDYGSSGNTANPWGYMGNIDRPCVNNTVLVGIDDGSVTSAVCCKLKIG